MTASTAASHVLLTSLICFQLSPLLCQSTRSTISGIANARAEAGRSANAMLGAPSVSSCETTILHPTGVYKVPLASSNSAYSSPGAERAEVD